jgi:hypothetical protein
LKQLYRSAGRTVTAILFPNGSGQRNIAELK